MIYTVTPNPAMDRTVVIERFTVGAVNRIIRVQNDPGGKGVNVSKVIRALGGESVALGILGGSCGAEIEKMLGEEGIQARFIHARGETRTNTKIVDPVLGTVTDINEPGAPAEPEALDRLQGELLQLLQPGDIAVLAGSAPQGAPETLYYRLALACREKGARVFLDADGALFRHGVEAAPWLIKPNREELGRLAGRELHSLHACIQAGEALLDKGIHLLALSLGGEGALFLTKEKALHAEGLRVPVLSTVGAGDAMMAALALGSGRGLTLEDTLRLALAASAAKVMRRGTQAPERETVERLMKDVRIKELA